jgi:peptidoglycan/LPS O-acetylase OafA/YrhL
MPLVAPLFPYRRPEPPATPPATPRTGPVREQRRKPARDAGIDAIRAGSLLVVVVLHSLMVGVETSADGGLQTSVALSGSWGFTVASWFFQVMPLFFIAGGFASLTQWRRLRAQGVTASSYVLGRVRRLVVPTAVMVTCVGGALLTARVCGASDELLASAGLHAVQPLWFLAVYVGCTALVPAMAWLHRRHRWSTLAWLAVGAVAVDVLARATTSGLGFLNLALVWPLLQQLGFLVLDGVGSTCSRRRLLGGAAGCLALLGVLVGLGYSPNMLVNLNPPTSALLCLGGAQFFLLVALRPRLDAALVSTRARTTVAKLSGWSMGVYLWHLPMALVLVAVLGGMNMGLPRPESMAWWFTRIPWLLAVAALTVIVVPVALRLESILFRAGAVLGRMLRFATGFRGLARVACAARARWHAVASPAAVTVVAVVSAVIGTGAVLVLGGSSWVGVPVACALLWTSVYLSRRP